MLAVNFWDYNIWGFIVQFSILMIAIVIGNILIKKIGFLRKSLLPTAVVGGLLILILKSIPWFRDLINTDFMEMMTYHTLALGFIAITLKKSVQLPKKGRNVTVLKTGMLTVNTYLIQGILGLALTILLSVTIIKGFFPASGLLLPMGYGQGTGQALNFGIIYQGKGFENGPAFGLAIAAIGFILSCIGGVVAQNIMRRKGQLPIRTELVDNFTTEIDESSPDEIGMTDNVDKFTIQISFVIGVYLLAFLAMTGLGNLASGLGDFGVKTVKPLIYGFNFLFGVTFAVLFKLLMKNLKRLKFMEKDYTNNFMLNRIAGFTFDLMIVAGVAGIEIESLKAFWLPLLLICTLGFIITFCYLRKVCKRLYPEYSEEAFFSMFGMLIGTASTGMILLREIDPKLETPAANNLAMQTLPAILFGFPLMFLIPYAGDGITQSLIALGVCMLMFVVLNSAMLYSKKNTKIVEEKVE